MRRLSRRVVDGPEHGEVGALPGRACDVLRGVRADPDHAQTEGARIGDRQAAGRKVHAVGSGCQRDVGAIVDQKRRCEPRADVAQRAGPFEQLPGGKIQLPQLHAGGAAGKDGERRLDGPDRIARGRRDQVQPDHAAPITPASGLDALP